MEPVGRADPHVRVDAHVRLALHRSESVLVGRDDAAVGGRAALQELAVEMEGEGIDMVVAVVSAPSIDATLELLDRAQDSQRIAGVVGWVDLSAPDVEGQLDGLRSAPGGSRLVGLQHPIADEPDAAWLTRSEVRRGLASAAAVGLAFDLDVTTRELPSVLATCRELPELRCVIDHLASPPIASGDLSAWGGALLPLAELSNVCVKLSGLVTQADWRTWSIDDLRDPVELAVDAFGAGRSMLGSDWPRCLLAGSYADAIEVFRYLLDELPAHELEEIDGATAMRVYRLAQHVR